MNVRRIAGAAVVAVASMTLTVQAQNFGAAKTKVTLQRKLPALIHVPESSIRVKASMHGDTTNLAQDLQSQLETELLKEAGFKTVRFERVGRIPPLAKSMIAVATR